MRLTKAILVSLMLVTVVPIAGAQQQVAGLGIGASAGTHTHPTTPEDVQLMTLGARLRESFGIKYSFDNTEADERAKKMFGTESFFCELVIRPDGSIRKVHVLDNAKSKEFEDNAVAQIEKAAPFKCSGVVVDQSYAVQFPSLRVKTMDDFKSGKPEPRGI